MILKSDLINRNRNEFLISHLKDKQIHLYQYLTQQAEVLRDLIEALYPPPHLTVIRPFFKIVGDVATGNNNIPPYLVVEDAPVITMTEWACLCLVPPTGDSLDVTITKNSTINIPGFIPHVKLSIPDGWGKVISVKSESIKTPVLKYHDRLDIDVTKVGSTTPGSGLVVMGFGNLANA